MEVEADIKAGVLHKKEPKGKGFQWKEYYFVLSKDQQLYWFKSIKDSKKKSKAKGSVKLPECNIRYPNLNPPETQSYAFQIVLPDATVSSICANSENEASDWVDALRVAVTSKGDLNKQAVLIQEQLKKTGHDIPPEDLDFDDSAIIGSGASGIVKRGLWLKSTEVAVKALKNVPEFTDQKELISFYKEIETLSKLRHSNIVQMYGFCKKGNFLCLVTEYVRGGNLQEALANKAKYNLDNKLKIEIAQSMVRGMVYLHSVNVIHRDLKPANILIENWDEAKVKVCDFGLSKVVKKSDAQMTVDTLGSPQYAAPELNFDSHTSKVDVFSFGIILWEIMLRQQPWADIKFGWQFAERYTKGERPELPQGLFSNLIAKCWAQDPNQRPDFKEVYEELEDIKKLNLLPSVSPNVLARHGSSIFNGSPKVNAPSENFYATAPSGPSRPSPSISPRLIPPSPHKSPSPQVDSPVESFYMSATPSPVNNYNNNNNMTNNNNQYNHNINQSSQVPNAVKPVPVVAQRPAESFYMAPGKPNSPSQQQQQPQQESFYMSTSGNPVSPQTGRGEGYVNAFQMAQLTKLAKDQQNVRTGSPAPSIGSVRNSAESPYLSTAAIQNLNIRTSSGMTSPTNENPYMNHNQQQQQQVSPAPVRTPLQRGSSGFNASGSYNLTVTVQPKLPTNGYEEKFARLFGNKQKETWINLSSMMKNLLNATPRHLSSVKYLFDDGGNVDRSIWDHFLLWFTPLASSPSQEGFDIDTIVSIVDPSWFHGFLSSADAQMKLKGFADGTFLVRFSTANAGFFALSVAYSGMVGHWRIQSFKEPGKPLRYLFDEKEFASLGDIVHNYSRHGNAEPLKIKQPKPGQPDTCLLADPYNRAEQYYQNIH